MNAGGCSSASCTATISRVNSTSRVISKGTVKNDRVDKFELYEKFGVHEYWLVDPANQSVEVYFLDNKKYVLQQVQEIEGTVKSKLLAGFELDLMAIFN